MPAKAWTQILDEVRLPYDHGGVLCLQAARYHFPDRPSEDGFRFCWRDGQTGAIRTLRGQTRLPDLRAARLLMAMAEGRDVFRSHCGADAGGLPRSIAL